MRPTIPGDLNALSSAELKALARDVKAWALARSAEKLSTDETTEVIEWLAGREYIVDLAIEKEAAEVSAATAATEALAKATGKAKADARDDEPEAPAAEPVSDPAKTAQTPVATPDVTGGEHRSDNPDDATKALAETSIKTTVGQVATADTGPDRKRSTLEYLRATDGVPGKQPGQGFGSWRELAEAALDKASTIRSNSSERFEVARITASYPKERQLSEDLLFNLPKFEPDELTAAFCAPATPYYGISCMNSTRRPVFNSLPQFQAPRGKVSIMPSPTLSQIVAGYGVWLDTDDDDAAALKECATITCGTPTEYKMYAVWRCLTVKNLMAMTYPELVEAWLNRLAAAQARLAEQRLLNAMGTAATDINAPALGYGASVSITTTILNYIALYQETQRWDITENMHGWAHRSVLTGIKMDIARRRTDNGMPSIVTDGEVNAMFARAGVNMTWFLDVPTWGVPMPVVGASTLNLLPQSVQILLAPPGKLAVIDRGNVLVGVTGNPLRDNTSNSRNEHTYWFENAEGIVNSDTCPAHILDVPVCWNGAQIADLIIDCQGRDEVGYQS